MMTNDLQFGIDDYYRMLNNNKNLDQKQLVSIKDDS